TQREDKSFPLLRYSGGGLGWGPDGEEGSPEAKPPPQPSPGVPGEGEELPVEASRTLEPATVILERLGRMPLPPYIKREKDHDERDEMDRLRYQTVFAKEPGAVAAPTAALHFSPQLLEMLAAQGIERT